MARQSDKKETKDVFFVLPYFLGACIKLDKIYKNNAELYTQGKYCKYLLAKV